MPEAKPINLHCQQFDLIPIPELIYAPIKIRSDLKNVASKFFNSAAPDLIKGTFGDDEPGLKIIGTIDQDQRFPVIDIAEDLPGIVGLSADPEPEYINGNTVFDEFELGCAAGHGMAAIAADYEVRQDLNGLSVGDAREDARNPATIPNEFNGLVLHPQFEGGKSLGMVREKIQEIPVGHQGYELAMSRHMPKVDGLKCGVSNNDAEGSDLLMGQSQEVVKKPQFMEHFQRGWMHGISAEIAEEILVLLEHGDLDTVAGHEISEHHTGRSATHNAAGRF